MSITYIPDNEEVPELELNTAGASLLGMIGFRLNYCTNAEKHQITDRIPYEGNDVDSKRFATAISTLSDEIISHFYADFIKSKLFEGSLDDFKDLLNQFVEFFSKCEGYTTI